MDGAQTWHQAVAARAAALEREQAAATTQARQLLADFVHELRQRAIPPHPLRARVPDRRTTYRTGLTGWYLRRNRSLGVSVDGEFYILDVPPRLSSRLFGVRVVASDPPLRVGMGARDGESMPLADLLQRRLEAGPSWP